MGSSRRGLLTLAALSLTLGFLGLSPSAGLLGGSAGGGAAGERPPESIAEAGASDPSNAPGGPSGPVAGPAGSVGGNRGGAAPVPPARSFKCAAGLNGGKTDRGVNATEIKLASTAVLDGPAASLLKPSVTAMRAVINTVNRAGGICGRFLKLDIRNDGFDAQTGRNYIRNFAEGDYFALAVVPSAEGLGQAILNGEIDKFKIPVVGTDGMRIEQYSSPWVWPVATATVSTMRILAEYGFQKKKARTFAIVYDDRYLFGKEGSKAFISQVKAMGGSIKIEQPLEPSQTSFAPEVERFNNACQDGAGDPTCDMVAFLLLPDTAKQWMAARPAVGRLYTAGAQTLFTEEFAQGCVRNAEQDCADFGVWTGYNPAIGRFAGLRGVNAFVNDVKAVDPRADTDNQFMEGAYLGMNLLVKALQKVGPDLTRARLRAVLDSMTLKTDLASTLTWRPGNHAANTTARAFGLVYGDKRFQGWRDENTGFRRDPQGGPR